MASTPSQNNAFELMTTGEKSGQWGDITNVNMQIIDRATKGVGTITLTTTSYSLDTVDYSVSEGQYAVLVFSGTPGGTCTVTINPSDQQKVFIVRNTTPSSVVLTQGSGGNVTVLTGKSAVVYADGAGSGAAVVDVTALLDLASAGALIGSNDLSDVSSASTSRTNLGLAIGTDVLAYDSNLQDFVSTFTLPTSDSTNGYVLTTNGSGTLQFSPTGSGDGSVTSVAVSGGTTGLTTSGGPITTAGTITIAGTLNVANGGTGSTTASGARTNLGLEIGTDVLAYDSNLQSFVTAFTLPAADGTSRQVINTNGSGTLSFATLSIDDLSDARTYNANLFFGSGAGASVTGIADDNIAIGEDALGSGTSNTQGGIAIGTRAGQNFEGIYGVFIGQDAGRFVDTTSPQYPVAIGYQAGMGSSVTGNTAAHNIAIGAFSLVNHTSGGYNIAVGYLSGNDLTSGQRNVAIGSETLTIATTSSGTVAVGDSAGIYTQSSNAVYVGRNAGYHLDGNDNVGIGYQALYGDSVSSTGYSNVAVGKFSGIDMETGNNNTLLGAHTGTKITTGTQNVYVGAADPTDANTYGTSSGNNNIVVGYNSFPSSQTVSNEITIGNSSHNVVRYPGTTTVSGLPSASTVGAGARSFVTDANATTFASVVAGGGSNGVPVYSDGTNWRIG